MKNCIILLILLLALLTNCSPPEESGSSGNTKPTPGGNETGCLLTINITGSGTVDKNPIAQYYSTGTNVTLTALPNQGNAFDHWEGDINTTYPTN